MNPYAIVPGEEELGVQKRCPQCGEWWPAMDPEFWPRAGSQGFLAWCRDCKYQRRVDRRVRPAALVVGAA